MTFQAFWGAYPRKVARFAAEQVWAKMSVEDQQAAQAAISQHAAYWRACNTAREFIPHARTWLYQRRWEDEVEMPSVEGAVEWWRTERGVIAKGAELGIPARAGEDMTQYKQRLVDAMVQRRVA